MHHAYLLVGDSVAARSHLDSMMEELGITLKGSPDFFLWAEDLFGIDEARALSAAALRKAFGEQKIFLITPERLTLEAQNALLKTFEDPYPDTHFFLAVREEELVLPTLRSRMEMVRVQSSALDNSTEAEKFLGLSIPERLNFIKKFVDKEQNLSVFLDGLLEFARVHSLSSESLKRIYNVRLMSDDRGASPRLILEHLALVLP